MYLATRFIKFITSIVQVVYIDLELVKFNQSVFRVFHCDFLSLTKIGIAGSPALPSGEPARRLK